MLIYLACKAHCEHSGAIVNNNRREISVNLETLPDLSVAKIISMFRCDAIERS